MFLFIIFLLSNNTICSSKREILCTQLALACQLALLVPHLTPRERHVQCYIIIIKFYNSATLQTRRRRQRGNEAITRRTPFCQAHVKAR